MSASSWRRQISTLSEPFFPGIFLQDSSPHAEIISSLPLQMALYFNVCFFPVWLATTVTMMATKLHCLSSLYRFIALTVQAAATLIELLRLYLGYLGNLTETIPEAAGFWMLSILLQLPLQTFLVASQHLELQPIEYTVQGVMLVLLLSELAIGYFALRRAARHQVHRFHCMQAGDGTATSGHVTASSGHTNQGYLQHHEE